jgi:hypothetical protein
MDDEDLAAELGAAGRARVMEIYTWQSVAAQTAQWYRDYLGEVVPHPTTVQLRGGMRTHGLNGRADSEHSKEQ